MLTAGGQRQRLVVAGFGMVAHKLVERLVALEALGEYAVTIIGEEPYAASNRVLMISFLAASVFGAGAAAVMGHRSARLTFWLHLLAVWILPVLIAFHILAT